MGRQIRNIDPDMSSSKITLLDIKDEPNLKGINIQRAIEILKTIL